MKYYIDTEFIEGSQKKRFLGIHTGESKPTIDLISIGIVSEDDREYYAISKDFNLKEAWNRYDLKETSLSKKYIGFYEEKVYWIRVNVLLPIYFDLLKMGNIYGDERNYWSFTYNNLKKLIKWYGKTNEQIANEICAFVYSDDCNGSGMSPIEMATKYEISDKNLEPEFYAYYADYDWVAFCWLFGKMIDLPKGFPMYCRDLKQELDRVEEYELKRKGILRPFKELGVLPKQTNEHNALADAKWNKELANFLKNLS